MKLDEMNKLENYLREHKYRFGRGPLFDGEQIIVYGETITDIKWDAICCSCSYGGNAGLLEVMGDIVPPDADDTVIGNLTAEDIIRLLEKK